jgi:drug/metabolite transporter (DMT)-like permease
MTSIAETPPPAGAQPARRALAVAAILICVIIWALQFAMARLAVLSSLTGGDLATLRFTLAAPLMIAILSVYGWRDGGGVRWSRAFVLTLLAGAPIVLMIYVGLQFAPASHAACLQTGTVAIVSTIIVLARSGGPISLAAPFGLALAVVGLAAVALGGAGALAFSPRVLIGDALFVVSGVCWSCFTVLLMRWQVSPLVATAMVNLLSLAFLPLLFIFFRTGLFDAPWGDIVLHGAFQGLVNACGAFLLWAYAARVLGAVALGMFNPLVPALGALFGGPLLGEWPSPAQWLGILAVAGGLSAIALTQRRPPPIG